MLNITGPSTDPHHTPLVAFLHLPFPSVSWFLANHLFMTGCLSSRDRLDALKACGERFFQKL